MNWLHRPLDLTGVRRDNCTFELLPDHKNEMIAQQLLASNSVAIHKP